MAETTSTTPPAFQWRKRIGGAWTVSALLLVLDCDALIPDNSLQR